MTFGWEGSWKWFGREARMCSCVGHEGACWSSLCWSPQRGVHHFYDCKLFCVDLGLCISRTVTFSFVVDLYYQQNKYVVKASILKKKKKNPLWPHFLSHFSIPLDSWWQAWFDCSCFLYQEFPPFLYLASPHPPPLPCQIYALFSVLILLSLPAVSDAICTLICFSFTLDLLLSLLLCRILRSQCSQTPQFQIWSLFSIDMSSSALNILTMSHHKYYWLLHSAHTTPII